MLDVTYDADSDSTKDSQNGDDAQGNTSPSDTQKNMSLGVKQNIFADLSPSDEDEVSEVESFIIDQDLEEYTPRLLLSSETVAPETQERFEALLEAAGLGKASADGKVYNDREVIQRLTSSVDCALHEAEAKLARMRAEQQAEGAQQDSARSLATACSQGDIGTVRQLLGEGRSVHETTEEGESLLSLACSAGYYELAQVLLAMRANVEDRGIKGDCTPLMEAASGGFVDIVRLLIEHGADVNAQSSAGNTPLHYAACGGHEEVVRRLIEANANVEEHNENGHTPLMEAASAGHVGIAGILLYFGAGINTHSNEFKESALTLACYKGHLEMVKFLLEAGADHEHKTDEMHTALMEACMDGHVDVARLLLDSGAQVNMPIDSFESPLTLAACGGHVELANLLIEQGADLEEVNDEGYTPLMEAAREGHEDMVALLLAHGANINGQTEETQETALTLACCGGFQEVGDFLIKAGADLELGCSTPLMEAGQEGHLELVKYLIQVGANVHAQTQTGDTALTYACENGHTDVAEVLLEAGAQMEHESEGGRTPLMKAARAGHLCTVQFLISKGADVNRGTSTSDHTVLSLACAGGHLNVVELLLRHGAESTHKLKDGSTMLIEAAKGGHTQVVNMLLDWPSNMLSPSQSDLSAHLNSPSTQAAASASEHVDVPRVPTHGLAHIVPREDPNTGAAAAHQLLNMGVLGANPGLLVQAGQQAGQLAPPGAPAVPGEVDLSQLSRIPRHEMDKIPAQAMDMLKENLRRVMSQNTRVPPATGGETGEPPTVGDVSNTSNNAVTSGEGAQLSDPSTDSDKNYPEGGSPLSLDFDDQDMKASDRLEAFINKMMQKAELLNTTREEQILKKQQILEELQKVGNLLLDSVLKSRQQGAPATQDTQNTVAAVAQPPADQGAENPFSPPVPPAGVARDELEAYLTCFGEMGLGGEEDAEPSCCHDAGQAGGRERLEGMVEELRVKLERTSGMLGEGEAPPGQEESSGVLTCAPDPVPLHIALKNDLQAQVELQQRLAQQLINSQVTRVANDRPATRRRKEPIGEEGGQAAAQTGAQEASQAKLAKQESVSSQASSSDSAPTDPSIPREAGLPPSRESLVPPDGTSVDPLPYFTPPTGSPARDNSEESNPSSSDSSSRASSEEVDLTSVVPADERVPRLEDRLSGEPPTGERGSSLEERLSGEMPTKEQLQVPAEEQISSLEERLSGVVLTEGAVASPEERVSSLEDRLSGLEGRLTGLVPGSDGVNTSDTPPVNSTAEPAVDLTNVVPISHAGLDMTQMVPPGVDLSSLVPVSDVDLSSLVPVSDVAVDLTSLVSMSHPVVDLMHMVPVSGQMCHTDMTQLGSLVSLSGTPLPDQVPGAGEGAELAYVMPVPDNRLNNMVTPHPPPQFTQHQMQLLQEQLRRHQLLRHRLKMAKDKKVNLANSLTQARHMTPGGVALSPHSLQHLHNLMIPLQLEPLTTQTITPANAAAIQQQLEQQRQQLQDQLALQQKLQIELQQQLKLQQEHEQLKQQLKQHQQQVALQQKQLQAQTNKVKGNQVKIQQASATILTTTNTMESLQQEINKQELQQLQLQQVQQHLQQLHQQLQQVQQLQNNHQLTQQELLQQAQQLQQQLQVAQMQQFAVQPLQPQVQGSGAVTSQSGGQQVQVNQMTQLLTQQDLLQHAQQLQQLAQLQRQQQQQQQTQQPPQQVGGGRVNPPLSAPLTSLPTPLLNNTAAPTAQKKAKKKLFTQQQLLPPPQQLQHQQLQQQQFHQLQVLQQQQLQQQLQQQQLYQLQQQQQQAQYQQAHLLQNPQFAQQIATYQATVASNAANIPNSQLYDYYLDLITPSTPATPNPSPASPQIASPVYPAVELDAQTDSNHDTALTLACAGGHAELVSLLLSRGADIEHRDKKGFTPLILASTAGHADGCEILLDHGADLEAQSDRTKDTALSLACSGGRYEVVELLLTRGANKEHRNVSDYTPLSLAASGGYVNIIKLLLSHGAEINSRTGSKLGISPLMLAAMNGHTAAVKLLLDLGSDINAQIETNRNTALTLACFQGRHEVVSLLVDRKANIEHRAKTGLTPLMEAASGGYVEVGRVLLDKGADVNATPVPSSRDTALTIAADKGHYRFVELLIQRGALIDVKNKKGNSPLWLACNGGHQDVVQLLVTAKADVDSQDNRKVSCLMAAFRKGHVKVIKWMVKHVTQFPSDPECMRYIQTLTDKELLKKCHQCMEIIVSAKDRQAAEANKNASILLEQIDAERSREETKRERAARKREKRRMKKKEKQEKERIEKEVKEKEVLQEQEKRDREKRQRRDGPAQPESSSQKEVKNQKNREASVDSGPDPPESCSSSCASSVTSEFATQPADNAAPADNASKKRKGRKGAAKPEQPPSVPITIPQPAPVPTATPLTDTKLQHNNNNKSQEARASDKTRSRRPEGKHEVAKVTTKVTNKLEVSRHDASNRLASSSLEERKVERNNNRNSKGGKKSVNTGIGDLDDFESLPGLKITPSKVSKKEITQKNPSKGSKSQDSNQGFIPAGKQKGSVTPSPKKGGRREEGWKEVIRRSKKIMIPGTSVTRVIGRHGVNINAIRETSGANIDIDKAKGAADRTVTIKGPAEATKRAFEMIQALIKDPEKDVDLIIPRVKSKVVSTNTLTISSNVWHNSMVESPSGPPGSKQPTRLLASAVRTTTTNVTTRPQPAKPPNMQPPLGAFQVTNGTAIWGHPGQPPLKVSVFSSTVSYTPDKSPSVVAKQLFSSDTPASSAAAASLTGTYSSPSTAKTAVVNTSLASPAFSTKVEAASKQKPANQRPAAATPGAISRPSQPTPRPQLNGGDPPYQGPPGAPPHYSPFNNLFSSATDGILGGKKEETPGGSGSKNFASVAAAGLSTTTYNLAVSSAQGLQATSELDPSKAPGYKAPGQRGDPEAGGRAPGYRMQYMMPDAFTSQQQAAAFLRGEYGRPVYRQQYPGFVRPGEQSPRAGRNNPPLRTDEEYSSPHTPMTLPKIESNLNPNAPNFMSRTGQLSTPPPGGATPPPLNMGPSVHPAFRPSYPTPPPVCQHNTPQQSPFNPPLNSPHPGAFNNNPQPFNTNSQQGPFTNTPQQGPFTNTPQQGPFTNNPQQGPFTNNPQQGPFTNNPQQSPFNPTINSPQPGLPISDLQALLAANASGLLGPGAKSLGRTGSPLTVQARGPPGGGKEEGGVRSMTGSPQQPPSAHAPAAHSPAAGPGGPQISPLEEAGPPRPIGVERGTKRGSTPSYPDGYLPELDQLRSQGLWGFSDPPSEWLVTSAISHPVMSSVKVTSSLDLGSRPHSQPAFNSVLPGPGYLDTASAERLDGGIQTPGSRSLFTSADSTSVSSVFVNGLHTARPSQVGLAASIGSGGLWGQSPVPTGKLESGDSTGSTDSKLGWSWPGTPPNA